VVKKKRKLSENLCALCFFVDKKKRKLSENLCVLCFFVVKKRQKLSENLCALCFFVVKKRRKRLTISPSLGNEGEDKEGNVRHIIFFITFTPIFTGVLMGFRLCVKIKINKNKFLGVPLHKCWLENEEIKLFDACHDVCRHKLERFFAGKAEK
jgi:hypothetical protein